ncbi:hypothetical protein HDV02_005617 [Globomyces sp. JEL0801]|nr:hypothetical protein HDV02_005617 [Globomyces sp. JEL0801]
MSYQPQPKKLRFDEEGEVKETIEGVLEVETPVETAGLTEEQKELKLQSKLSKRNRLRKKKVQKEVAFHKALFGDKEEATKSANSETVQAEVSPDLKSADATDSKKKEKSSKVVESKEKESKDVTVSEDKETKAKKASLYYLSQFINDKQNWKFQKVRQTWILRNLYYQHQIDNAQFKNALLYMANMGSKAKAETIEEAKLMIEQANNSKKQQEDEQQEGDEKAIEQMEITDTILKRAKKIVKQL